jgi:hypothetical protein
MGCMAPIGNIVDNDCDNDANDDQFLTVIQACPFFSTGGGVPKMAPAWRRIRRRGT